MSSRRGKTFLAWLLAAFVGGVAGACLITPDKVHGPCQVDVDCPDDDHNPCTKGICDKTTGFCAHQPQALPFGDPGCDDDNPCTIESCDSGACVHTPTDAPPDDGKECTIDACNNGVASYTNVMDGTPCGASGGLECNGGACKCTKSSECGTSTDCLKVECTNNECSSNSLAAGTVVDNNQPGDCLKRVCDGKNNVTIVPDADPPADTVTGNCKTKACDEQGNAIDIDDPTDSPPTDNNECTKEGCNGGVVINYENAPDGMDCGVGPSCGPVAGGKYAAVGHQTCQTGICTTPMPTDCNFNKCDANNLVCATTCADATQCIAGTYCDAGNTCQLVAGSGQPCANQGQCSSGLYCVDGVCCNAQCGGTCEQCNNQGLCAPIANGMDPAAECAGADACNGAGVCAKPQGSMCGADSECLTGFCADGFCCNSACSGACNRCDIAGSQGTCKAADINLQYPGCTGSQACDGAGNCKTVNGQACGSTTDCVSAQCQDGVCCNSSCSGVCAVCNLSGMVGSCTNVPAGQQVGSCNVNNACDGMNSCKKINGQGCAANSDCVSGNCQDGYCCNSVCAGACARCDISGSLGTCLNVSAGQQVTGCNGVQACNGMNNCVKANGQTCGAASECATGFCVDGYCCNNACNQTCKACSNIKSGGSNGTCTFIPNGQDPDGECGGAKKCDGGGACN